MRQNVPPDLNALRGEWHIVRIGKDGKWSPESVVQSMKLKFTVDGDQYSVHRNGKIIERGRISLKCKTRESLVNQEVIFGNDQGTVKRGIIRIVDDTLQFLQADPNKPRPSGFPFDRSCACNIAVMQRRNPTRRLGTLLVDGLLQIHEFDPKTQTPVGWLVVMATIAIGLLLCGLFAITLPDLDEMPLLKYPLGFGLIFALFIAFALLRAVMILIGFPTEKTVAKKGKKKQNR